MDAFRFRWTFFGVLIVMIVFVDAILLAVVNAIDSRSLLRNEGPLEVLQLVIVGMAAAGFIALIFRARHSARLVASGAAALCLLLFFREFETPVRNAVLDFMSSDEMLYNLSAALGVFLLLQIYLNWSHMPAFLGWLTRFAWWPFLLAGSFFVAGRHFEMEDMETIEEMFELNGYLILAFTAVVATYRTHKKLRL